MADSTLPIGSAIDLTPPSEAYGTWLEQVHSWVVTVDHKKIGLMYIGYAVIFLLVGGFEAILLRIQLAVPHNHFLSPEVFNRIFTMHGTTMVFLMGMPLIIGFANYLVPLMIGARDMAFPRMNAFSFWMTALGGLMLYYSFIGGVGLQGAGSAPDVTWWAYAPAYRARILARTQHGLLGVVADRLGIRHHRRRGQHYRHYRLHALQRHDDVSHAAAGMAVPGGLGHDPDHHQPFDRGADHADIDRYLGGHFFDSQAGGVPVVWSHFFWIFGHPEVYVLVLPAFAIANEVIPVFSRKAIFGYPAMVAASVGIGLISLSVWAHHMFTVGMTSAQNAFFVLSTALVGVPTGIKIFNWIATMWGGKIRFATAMLFCTAFLIQFLFAGLTGIMLSVAPWNWQLHNSYFVIAHFHYVLVGAIVFCFFGGFYYWFPKMTGKMLDERLGKWHFWLFLIGFHLCFDLMHIPGLLGMPRSIYTYEPGRGWDNWNMIVSVGGLIQGVATLIFAYNMVYSYFKGPDAGPDPWDAWTLEWATSSPPPEYNFASEPVVSSRRPLWDLKHPEDTDSRYE